MGEISKRTFFSSTIWKLLEVISTKGVSTVISILLARMLLPEDYGIVALTSIFIFLAGMLVSGGLEASLIRKQDVDDMDLSNALFFCLFVAGIIYSIFFFAAPCIAGYYGEKLLAPVLRVEMLSLFIGSFSIIGNVIVIRRFQFKKLCVINVFATVVGGTAGIALACCHFGVWALVLYTIIRDVISTVVVLMAVKWRIVFKISLQRLKSLISYSVWVLLATLVDFAGNNIYSATYGKIYSMKELGYYNKGGQLPELVGLQTFGAITGVLFPALAESQNDTVRTRAIVRKVVKISSYVIFPMMAGLAITGKRVVLLLFTEKWLPCLPVLWAACAGFAVNPFRIINRQLIYACGDSRKGMKIEVIRSILLLINLLAGVLLFQLDLYGLTFSQLWVAVVIILIMQWHTADMIGYSVKEWAGDIAPAAGLTLLMAVAVCGAGQIPWSNAAVLLLQIGTGAGVYVLLSALTGAEAFREIVQMIKGIRK